ncbi:hypothetical protein H0H92_008839 [Tricholoma furcatifolium]|nr:hypothetical protein H0H92_008839 [Tricholoma furcatifolium]
MHGRLLDIIEELLSRRVQPPEGIKSKRMDPAKTITAYAGSPKFGDLEDWLMSVCVYLAIAQYGLYDRFILPTTMQDAREAFCLAVYRTKDGVQGYYDVLLEHAQNMIVYPDEMTIREKFLEGIPEDMLVSLICDGGLAPEVNTIEEFVSEAKAYENSLKTASHYLERAKSRGLKVPATTGSSQLRASSATKRREEIKTVARPGPSKALVKKPAFKSFLREYFTLPLVSM